LFDKHRHQTYVLSQEQQDFLPTFFAYIQSQENQEQIHQDVNNQHHP